ncbi:hypothetical protein M427DRAFT_73655 [Gonapodya prolifera JEL478]|uniref:Homeobox domain-containing protein n=1 Tax=Gonapodya prolifera (strain JEL478) TaxID=1344416 RepID=A0A139A238_GONPJ|nr:hypothetical protein M427DRAFT_73655 [Gonapodya prolifera JEL478]|eukprot:KXS10708.1 hypothetical protein M427DRAFT_73655 [Gonapodya prolifera JEL478]
MGTAIETPNAMDQPAAGFETQPHQHQHGPHPILPTPSHLDYTGNAKLDILVAAAVPNVDRDAFSLDDDSDSESDRMPRPNKRPRDESDEEDYDERDSKRGGGYADSGPKRRRATADETRILNAVLEKTFFPDTELRLKLAKRLGMSPRKVQIWFQNRRQSLGVTKRHLQDKAFAASVRDRMSRLLRRSPSSLGSRSPSPEPHRDYVQPPSHFRHKSPSRQYPSPEPSPTLEGFANPVVSSSREREHSPYHRPQHTDMQRMHHHAHSQSLPMPPPPTMREHVTLVTNYIPKQPQVAPGAPIRVIYQPIITSGHGHYRSSPVPVPVGGTVWMPMPYAVSPAPAPLPPPQPVHPNPVLPPCSSLLGLTERRAEVKLPGLKALFGV